MRLLNTSTLKVEEFFGNAVPKYAILSHTWGEEEITLQDMLGDPPSRKKGFQKLINSCKQAKKNNLGYIWIDTCCIDKSSSAELSEAINSMYQWYNKSVCCYVFLSDVPDTTDPSVQGSRFRESRWFTRGWTLQELIAPETRIFFSASWEAIGCIKVEEFARRRPFSDIYESTGLLKIELLVAMITGIDVAVLKGLDLSRISIARRMSWAAKRNTTRMEDVAYCLMGIFDVNMPLLYGEGPKAFMRLQEEILKNNDDESIFAHSRPYDDQSLIRGQFSNLLATSTANFSGWAEVGVCRSRPKESSVPVSMTSKGLRLQLPLCFNSGLKSYDDTDIVLALLDCKLGEDGLARLAVPLGHLRHSNDQYLRHGTNMLYVLSPTTNYEQGTARLIAYRNGQPKQTRSVRIQDIRKETIYVVSENYWSSAMVDTTRPYFVLKRVLQPLGSSLVLENVYPRHCWNHEVGILQNLNANRGGLGCVSAVVSLQDKELGLGLSIILGLSYGRAKADRPELYSSYFFEPWCRISRIIGTETTLSVISDARVEHAFQDAEREFYGNMFDGKSVSTTPWIGDLEVKVNFEPTEFLGREGYTVQVEVSEVEYYLPI